jgi:hypothetical protein
MAKALRQPQIEGVQSPAAQMALTRAVTRAAEILGLSGAELSSVLGVSAASVSRMATGQYLLQPARKEWQLGSLFVRLFRSLDSITGGRDEHSRAWMRGNNRALRGVPAEMLNNVESFVRVVQYLDASRAQI